jgi:hypothetical protein
MVATAECARADEEASVGWAGADDDRVEDAIEGAHSDEVGSEEEEEEEVEEADELCAGGTTVIFTAGTFTAIAAVVSAEIGAGASGERTCAFIKVGAGGRTGETV